MRIRLKFLGQAAVGMGMLVSLSACSTSGKAVRHDSLLGSRNVIPAPYARPAVASSGLIPSSPSSSVKPVEPLLPESDPIGFVPAEVSAPVMAPQPEMIMGEAPAQKAVQVIRAETPSRPLPQASSEVYVVRKHDTLSEIARSHGVNWQDIAALNPSLDPNRIKVGDKLVMPAGAHTAKIVASAAKAESKVAVPAKKSVSVKVAAPSVLPADGVYTVVSGDNLSKLGSRYKVKISDIRSWNSLKSDNLSVGQKLKLRGDATVAVAPVVKAAATTAVTTAAAVAAVPGEPLPAIDDTAVPAATLAPVAGAEVAVSEAPANIQFMPVVVTEGDTLEKLAESYLTTVDDILKYNPQVKSNADLKPGTTLRMSYNINQIR